MAWVERNPDDGYTIHDFPLEGANPVSGINLSSRIIWESSQHLHLVTLPLQFFHKRKGLGERLWIKPLIEIQDTHEES